MKENKFDAKKSSLIFLLAFLIVQVVLSFWQIILKTILTIFHYHDVDNFLSNPFLYMIFTLAQRLVFVGIFVFSLKNLNLKKEIKQKPLNWKLTLTFLVFGIITMFALSYFINFVTMALNLLHKPSTSIPYEINNWSSYLFSIVSLALLPAIGEELLFRATIFNGLKSKGKLYAVIMSSVMFMIFHFNLSQLYYPLLFGMLLGIAYALTDSIIVPISMHFLNNALNITLQFASNGSASSTKLYQVIIGVVIYLLILYVSLFIMDKKETQEQIALVKQNNNQKLPSSKETLNELPSNNQSTTLTSINSVNKNTSSDTPFYKTDNFLTYLPFSLMVVIYIFLIFV